MNLVRANEGSEYSAPGHFGGVFVSKHGKDLPGNKHLAVSVSTFEPGGGCDYLEFPEDWPLDLCYYLLEGELKVTTKNGETFVFKAGDTVLWTGGDARGFINETDKPAKLLVIIAQ